MFDEESGDVKHGDHEVFLVELWHVALSNPSNVGRGKGGFGHERASLRREGKGVGWKRQLESTVKD